MLLDALGYRMEDTYLQSKIDDRKENPGSSKRDRAFSSSSFFILIRYRSIWWLISEFIEAHGIKSIINECKFKATYLHSNDTVVVIQSFLISIDELALLGNYEQNFLRAAIDDFRFITRNLRANCCRSTGAWRQYPDVVCIVYSPASYVSWIRDVWCVISRRECFDTYTLNACCLWAPCALWK